MAPETRSSVGAWLFLIFPAQMVALVLGPTWDMPQWIFHWLLILFFPGLIVSAVGMYLALFPAGTINQPTHYGPYYRRRVGFRRFF